MLLVLKYLVLKNNIIYALRNVYVFKYIFKMLLDFCVVKIDL